MITSCDLDHVALAVERHSDVLPRYVDQLGGIPLAGGPDPGFSWAQFGFANGMRLELLEPHDVERFDFLRRFLDRNGPGPHHITFKVGDIEAAIAEAEAAGYRPVNVHLDGPSWKEAFLHPKDAPGVVVQLAWTDHEHLGGASAPTSLVHIGHAVPALDDGLRLFENILGGRRDGEGGDADTQWIDLQWPGPGRIRLMAPRETGTGTLADWMGGRPGRVHHLLFAGAVNAGEITPETNFGTRLLLVES